MECPKMALICGFHFTPAEGKISYNQLDTRDPLIPNPKKPVASSTTWLPMAIKTNIADGPLCGFTTLFLPRIMGQQGMSSSNCEGRIR